MYTAVSSKHLALLSLVNTMCCSTLLCKPESWQKKCCFFSLMRTSKKPPQKYVVFVPWPPIRHTVSTGEWA